MALAYFKYEESIDKEEVMSVMRWGPMKELEDMRRDMDRLFEEFFTPARRRRAWPAAKTEPGVVVPNIDIFDRNNEVVIRAELPGVSKEDLDISLTKEALVLKGEVKREEEVKEANYYLSERSYGAFSRTIPLPVEVDSERAKASFKNGVLELVIPKKEEAKPKEIKIEVS